MAYRAMSFTMSWGVGGESMYPSHKAPLWFDILPRKDQWRAGPLAGILGRIRGFLRDV